MLLNEKGSKLSSSSYILEIKFKKIQKGHQQTETHNREIKVGTSEGHTHTKEDHKEAQKTEGVHIYSGKMGPGLISFLLP